jgi:signal peptidase II
LPLDQTLIITASILFLGALIIAFIKSKNHKIKRALIFIIIGAVSNLIDRLIYGAVLDYITLFGIAFINLADLLIFIGILRILVLR